MPVLLPRTPELVAVLLGILRRGAAYAVLDIRWPEQQRRLVASAVGARAVVASTPLGDLRRWQPPTRLFDAVAPPDDGITGDDPAIDGGSACCVFLTSGSTSAPKPVLSPHRATTRLFGPAGLHGEFGPSSRMPQWAPLPWDGAAFELWSMLLTGGTSVLCDDRLPTAASLRLMAAEGVDSTWLTSSVFNLIVDEDLGAFHGLRQIWTGGERLSADHVRRFLQQHPGIKLVNGYGPAESCVFVTTHQIRPEDCDDPGGIPLGQPVAGTSVLVLDGDRVCSRDEAGEISVAGDGLAIRYLGDDVLTARRFGEVLVDGRWVRIYRTGDRGWLGRDGLLRFLGREDRQVKVRGFRVELGEVEAHLRAVDAVAEAVVLADRDAAGSTTGLTAFYVPQTATSGTDPDSVRDRLVLRVPAHEVPDRLLPVPTIPVTANGKADHAALRAIAAEARRPDGDGAPPRDAATDPVLGGVLSVLSTVTGSPSASATRLDRGSLTSLQAMRACMRLGERFGVSIAPEQVLDAGTAGRLAELVRDAEPEPARAVPPGTGSAIPLADTQLGFLLEHGLRPDSKAGHCLVSWLVRGAFDAGAFRAALADVQRRQEALRACYQAAPEPFLVVEADAPVGFAELGGHSDVDGAWESARADLLRPLDIVAGEVWRANRARVGTDRHLVSLAIHHVAYDGWSEQVLVEELSLAYASRRTGIAPDFPGPTPDLAGALVARRAQSSRSTSSPVASEYWSRLLADLPEHRGVPGLPEDGPWHVAACSRPVPPAVLDGVDRAARSLGMSRFPVLVAAYAGALARTFGQDDFGIGVPVSVRQHASQLSVVTCLVDTVCLRLRPVPGTPLEEVARRAYQQMLLARGRYPLGFPDVVRAVNPPRQHGRNPLFRTMFVHQDNDVRQLALEPAEVSQCRRVAQEPMSEIVVEARPAGDGLRIDATFYREALSTGAVTALLDAYLDVLAGAPA